jgi:hypothetical protein
MFGMVMPGIGATTTPGQSPHGARRHYLGRRRLFLQIPNRVLSLSPSPAAPAVSVPPSKACVLGLPAVAGSNWPVSPPMSTPPPHSGGAGYWTAFAVELLLRKEVIQPHLPVRLPCYDFVPIASPTFDGSLPYGLGHRLRVLPTFVT